MRPVKIHQMCVCCDDPCIMWVYLRTIMKSPDYFIAYMWAMIMKSHDHEINRIFHHMYVRCVDFMVMFLTHDHVCARFRSHGESIYTWSWNHQIFHYIYVCCVDLMVSLFKHDHEITRIFYHMVSLIWQGHEISRIFHHMYMYVCCVNLMVSLFTYDHVTTCIYTLFISLWVYICWRPKKKLIIFSR